MKTRVIILRAFIALALVPCSGHAHPQVNETPRFDVQISQTGEERAIYTATNLGSKTVTAWVARMSFSQTNKEQGMSIWDSVLTDDAAIEPIGHKSENFSHMVRGPFPDKVEILAGIWADGETFGEAKWVKSILDAREMQAAAYERAAKLLQRGLDENWTREQYLQALNEMPSTGAIYSLRSTLMATPQQPEGERRLRHVMVNMLDTFTGKYERIRRAKPVAVAATSS